MILETGFGLGNNFLATWDAWRRDEQRCERLHVVAVERHPPLLADLQHAHRNSPLPALAAQLLQTWPPLPPNLHTMAFEGGRLTLLLALGDVAALLPALRLRADAIYLDGFAPLHNPDMWQLRVLKALGRATAPGATLATWTVNRTVCEGLATAGFVLDSAADKTHNKTLCSQTTAQHQPRHRHTFRSVGAAAWWRSPCVFGRSRAASRSSSRARYLTG